MKDKIIDLLYKYSREVSVKSAIQADDDKEEWIWSGSFEELATEIEKLINQEYAQQSSAQSMIT